MILVTGGAGYIGSVLCERLVKRGFDVRVFDKFYFGKKPLAKLDGIIEVVEGDIRNFQEGIFEDIDTVIHLAALSNDPTAEFNPRANYQINTLASKTIAQEAKKHGIKRFILASSCSIYDTGDPKNTKVFAENVKVSPTAAYSSSKFAAENEVLSLADKDFCVVVLRKGTIFGFSPRMRYDLVINTMVKDALSSGIIKIYDQGLQWRPLVDVEDVTEAYYRVLIADDNFVKEQIFNISLDNFLVNDLAGQIRKILAKNFSIKTKLVHQKVDQKVRSYNVSNEKAKKLLGFTPKVSLEGSIIKMVEKIKNSNLTDFENPIYYNIDWMRPILEKELRLEQN